MTLRRHPQVRRRRFARLWLAAASSAVAAGLAPAPPAVAIVPPTDCGTLTVEGRRYDVKADQVRCSTARPSARRYLATGSRPAGYRCRTYSRQTKLAFRCARGVRVFFAIKR